jgi:anti-sigma-K factor RskA
MISEDLEFQISQYVDGTLPAAERKSIDELVQRSGEARQVLAQYRQLDRKLATLRQSPGVRFDRLAVEISAQIDQLEQSRAGIGVAGRIGFFSTRWRIAAAVMVSLAGLIVARHATRSSAVSPKIAAPAVVDVTGPQADVATGPTALDVTVGPSPALAARNSRYGEGVIGQGTPRVVIGQLPKTAPDERLH